MSTFTKVAAGAAIAFVTMGVISVMSPETEADITFEQGAKVYRVRFSDWVQTFMHATYAGTYREFSVITSVKPVNGKARVTITGIYADTEGGRAWYRDTGSKIEERVGWNCKDWTQQGYPISLNDFEIDIRKGR